ncbi:hypothetical protein D9M71_730250 [compost metagenome]
MVERVQVVTAGGVLEPHHFRKQFGGGGHQRIEADVEGFFRTQPRGVDHPRFELFEARRLGEVGERVARAAVALAVDQDGLVVLSVIHFPDHALSS